MWWHLRFVLLCAACSGCASAPRGPFFGDEQYLRFGVDPRDEANALIQMYAEQSEPLALRIVGRDFTALGFMDRTGVSTRARIVTARGITVALDPEPGIAVNRAVRYALIAGPRADTQDADGDGFEEVFIERRTRLETCLLVYRVRDVGYADLVPTSVTLLGRERCPTAVGDVDHDGRAELLVDVELLDFALDAPPSVRVGLWAQRHRFVRDDGSGRPARYLAEQIAARELELESVRAAGESAALLRLAVELSALAELQGATTADQLARFDAALGRPTLDPRRRAQMERARSQIERGWGASAEPEPTGDGQLAERDASWYITPTDEQEGQERSQRRTADLPKSKGRAQLRRRGTTRSGDRAHRLRGQESARKTR